MSRFCIIISFSNACFGTVCCFKWSCFIPVECSISNKRNGKDESAVHTETTISVFSVRLWPQPNNEAWKPATSSRPQRTNVSVKCDWLIPIAREFIFQWREFITFHFIHTLNSTMWTKKKSPIKIHFSILSMQ